MFIIKNKTILLYIMSKLVLLYKDSSFWFKIVVFVILLLLGLHIHKILNSNKEDAYEGFDSLKESFSIKDNNNLYDEFYSSIYDELVANPIRTEYEIGKIIYTTNVTPESVLLDVGCGTGHLEHGFNRLGYKNIIGIDKSPDMIRKSLLSYPKYKYYVADIMNISGPPFNTTKFTHIMCLYFTIYYIENKNIFFKNCYDLLLPGGNLIVHVVDRNNFDPILPSGNPFYILSPQNYVKKRITTSNVDFNGYDYKANFKLNNNENKAIFEEKIKDKNTNNVRVNEHTLYMETIYSILNMARSVGFIIHSKIDMIECGYDYQYLYVFTKPS